MSSNCINLMAPYQVESIKGPDGGVTGYTLVDMRSGNILNKVDEHGQNELRILLRKRNELNSEFGSPVCPDRR